MKICGIIAEYNPFHNGHFYQLHMAKEQLGADYVIIAMSGDYVQRGLPAVCEKHSRAKMALENGADLVLELPVHISSASAEAFAAGGISLLDRLSVCTHLCFGCETSDTELLNKIAFTLSQEPEKYQHLLKSNLKSGLSYPNARTAALQNYFSDFSINIEETLNAPNNILAIEYMKALFRQNSSMLPYPIQRKGAGYHETLLSSEILPSATSIREILLNASSSVSALESSMPSSALEIIAEQKASSSLMKEDALDSLLFYRLMEETPETLLQYQDVTADLAHKIIKNRNQYQGFREYALLLKSKELTYTRICRALLHICLKLEKEAPEISYARILGFRRDSAELLRKIKTHSQIPLLSKLSHAKKILPEDSLCVLEKNVFCSNIYEGILARSANRPFVHEYEKEIVIL